MKIISNFKDYYDFHSNIYGIDNNIVYNRKPIGEFIDGYYRDKEIIHDTWKELKIKDFSGFDDINKFGSKSFYWLIFCGKPYPLIETNYREFHLLDESLHSNILLKRKKDYWRNEWTEIGQQTSDLIELSRKLQQPIFIILSTHRITRHYTTKAKDNFSSVIYAKYPNLGELGFAKIYKSEQVYQDLCYFMANTINESPDTMKPSILSDKEKVLQHGFDLKQSFRHRIPN